MLQSLDNNALIFIIIVSTLVSLYQLSKDRNLVSNAIIVGNLALVVYSAYNIYTRKTGDQRQKDTFMSQIMKDISDEVRLEDGAKNPVKKQRQLENFKETILYDPYMSDVLKTLLDLKEINADIYYKVTKQLYDFFTLYSATLLLDNKSGSQHIANKVKMNLDTLDLKRKDIMENLEGLEYTLVNRMYNKQIERISLTVRASTYKCLNVLKNKFELPSFAIKPANF